MDANNSMINNSNMNSSSSSTKRDSKRTDKSSNSMTISKSGIKSRSKRAQKLNIECKNEKGKKFQEMSEELAVHIITCDDCLKKLLLHQAKLEKLGADYLNQKKRKNKKSKKRDINNSMQGIDIQN